MPKNRIAVIGFGLIGNKHAKIIESLDDVELVGLVENNKELIKQINISCKIFDDIDDLLKNEKVDGAIIATPTPLHVEQAKIFLEHKIPVLIEKPIANTSSEAEEIINLSLKNEADILVGHHRRYNKIIIEAKKLINDGQIGDIRSAMSICWFYKPDDYFDSAPWRKKKGAGPISVNLIHDVDLMRYFCGEVESVYAISKPSSRQYENEDLASVILNFENSVVANMSVSDSIVSPWSWETTSNENSEFPNTNQSCYLIGGSNGSLSIPDLNIWQHDKIPDWTKPINKEKIKFEYNNPLVEQIVHFNKVIEKKSKPLVSGIEGMKSLKVIEAIEKSSILKKPVDIK